MDNWTLRAREEIGAPQVLAWIYVPTLTVGPREDHFTSICGYTLESDPLVF
jgi:hypothetical protein